MALYTATGYPVLTDDLGIMGGTSRDTSRTMIVEQSMSILMVIIAFAEHAQLDKTCRLAANLLTEHAETSRVEYCTIA